MMIKEIRNYVSMYPIFNVLILTEPKAKQRKLSEIHSLDQ